MELTLNIYERNKIVKTYTAESYFLDYGTVEDIINVVDVDGILNGKTDEEIGMAIIKVLPGVMGIIKPLLKDVFEGLTDDEIKKTRIKEIKDVIYGIIAFTINDIKGNGTEKN